MKVDFVIMFLRVMPVMMVIFLLSGCGKKTEKSAEQQAVFNKEKGVAPDFQVEITSDEVEANDEVVTFIGNVEFHHADFYLKCDHLVIHLNEGGSKPGDPFKLAVATGQRVVVERTNSKGEKETGEARKLEYDPRSGNITLIGGPPILQMGRSVVSPLSPEARIILLKGGSHKVFDSGKSISGIPLKNAPEMSKLPPGPVNAVRASTLANRQARQQFDKEPFSPSEFKKKIDGDFTVFTAVVPFALLDELKAEVFFNAAESPEIRISVLTSRLAPERLGEGQRKLKKLAPRKRK